MKYFPDKKFFLKWFFIALAVKFSIFLYLTIIFHQNYPADKFVRTFFVKSKDYAGYIAPIENLIDRGVYKLKIDGKDSYAFKMPGFLPVYAPVYWVFGRDAAIVFLVWLNVILDALSALLIGIIAKQIFNSRIAFYVAFWSYAFSFFISIYNHYVLTESVSASAVVIAVFFFVKATRENRWSNWLLSGVFLCWATFLRTVTGVFFPVVAIIYFIHEFRNNKISVFRNIFIWILPFLVCEVIWTTRNYAVMKKFVPLATTIDDFGSEHYKSLLSLIKNWGGDVLPWIPKSEGNWFVPSKNRAFDKSFSNSKPFGEEIFTPDYNFDSIVELRNHWWKMEDTLLALQERKLHAELFLQKSNAYKLSFKKHHPFQYYFFSPLKIVLPLIFIKHVHGSPFIQKNLFHKINKGVILMMYYVTLLLGFAGIILSFLKKNIYTVLIFALSLTYILTHAYLGADENRYLTTIFPFLILFACCTLLKFFEKSIVKIIPE